MIQVSYSQGQKGIQKALNKARDHATADRPYEVVVAAGTYKLNTALHIYSNTELTCEPGSVFKEKVRNNLLKVGRPGVDKEAHGFYYQNITINGGSWDRCKIPQESRLHTQRMSRWRTQSCAMRKTAIWWKQPV